MAKKKKKTSKKSSTRTSRGGSEIIDYTRSATPKGVVPRQLTEREMSAIEAFYRENLGDFPTVFHEIYSPDIHLDILPIPATGGYEWATIATMGMAAAPMNAPRGSPRYAELSMPLPSDWPLLTEELTRKDRKYYWPIAWLKSLARLPISFDTFLGVGHTVPTDGMHEPDDACPFCCALIIPLLTLNPEEEMAIVVGRKRIEFWSVFPMFESEMNAYLDMGPDSFFEAVDEIDPPPQDLANPDRKPYL